jgi:hypothetical protein
MWMMIQGLRGLPREKIHGSLWGDEKFAREIKRVFV